MAIKQIYRLVKFWKTYKDDRQSILLNVIFITVFFAYLAYDIVYLIYDRELFLPAILTISPFIVFTAALYFLYTPRYFELIKFSFLIAHTLVVSILVFHAIGTLPGIQYVYIAFGLGPIMLYKKKYLMAGVVFALINFLLYVIADVTEFSLVPADFIFPELFILPFRISLILLTVFAISALFSVLNDMNERKEKELSQLNIDLLKKNHLISEHELELTKANATKDKFISIIAHDLRNPLNSIIGFSDLLDKNGDGLAPQEQKEYIHTISETSRSLYDLLENLLHWSRIQGGKISYQPIPFSLTDAVNPNLGLVEAARQQKSIKIHNNIDPDVTVFADVPMITSVIRNLLGNALKFSEEGGNIFLENEIFENKLKVSVRDDGVGIDPARGTKLFQIEENTSTKGTSGESGTGLGLILCREFVELNQGEIGFDSEEGKGTTFWFTLQTEGPKDS